MSAFQDLLKKYGHEEPENERVNRPNPAEVQIAWNMFCDDLAKGYEPLQQKKAELPKEQGALDFIADNLAAGFGHSMENWGEILNEAMRPESMSSEEWDSHQSPFFKSLQQAMRAEGRDMFERNYREYDDGSAQYYLANILQSLPESAAIMAGSALAGIPLGGVLGSIGNTGRALLTQLPKYGDLAWKAAKAYQSGNIGGKIARTLTPQSPHILASGEVGAVLEAQSEANQAYNEAIANGADEQTARQIRDNVFKDNVGIISAFNIPQYNMLLGKPVKGLLGKGSKIIGGAGLEGAEEVAQEIASAYELGAPINPKRIRDAAVTGFGMGLGLGSAGEIRNSIVNRGRSSESEIEELEKQRKADYAKRSQEIANAYHNARSTENLLDTYNEAKKDIGIDNFMRAIGGQESGGDYDLTNSDSGAAGKFQIMPDNWATWAQDAGLSPDAPMTPENQELVAKNKMLEYYNEFGDWRDVASMWYSGHPISDYTEEEYTRPQYSNGNRYPSIKEYVDSVMTRFEGIGGEYSSDRQLSPKDNIFGVESYNMPTQSSRIDEQVAQLKNGWQSVIPQIGGVLRDKFGLNAEISSAARSAEHNAEVGGVPTSYHITRENGGDALDIVFDRETSQAEQDAIADYFKNTGLFSEVLYHDVGSGAHLHLGGLKTEKLASGNTVIDRANRMHGERVAQAMYDAMNPKPAQQEEVAEQPFDINVDNTATHQLLEQFANEKYDQAIVEEDIDTINFFKGMFNEDDQFQSTPENLNAIRTHYKEELPKWAKKQAPPQQPQEQAQPKPVQPKQEPTGDSNAFQATDLKSAIDKLREKATQEKNSELLMQINSNLRNPAVLEKLLQQNGIKLGLPQQEQAPQPENVVQKNKPPESVLTQPTTGTKAKLTPQEKLIKVASAPIIEGREATPKRKKQGIALIKLAQQHEIEIPNVDLIALKNGSTKKLVEWQDKLSAESVFDTPQQTPQQETAPEPMIEEKTEGGVRFVPESQLQAERLANSRNARAQRLLDSKAHTENVLAERYADETNDDNENPFAYNPKLENLNEVDLAEEQRQWDIEKQKQRDEENRKRDEAYKQKQERLRNFNESVKRNSEIDYAARAEKARQNRDRYEATKIDAKHAAAVEESERREWEEHLEEMRREEEEKANKEAEAYAKEKQAQAEAKNREKAQRKAIRAYEREATRKAEADSVADEIQFEDEIFDTKFSREYDHGTAAEKAHEAETARKKAISQAENEAMKFFDIALEEPPRDKSKREAQGKAIRKLLEAPSLEKAKAKIVNNGGLLWALKEGSKKAILKAQSIIDDELTGNRADYETNKSKRELQTARIDEEKAFEDELLLDDEMLERRMQDVEDSAETGRKRSGVISAQAEEQARQAKETANKKTQRKSQQAGEAANESLAKNANESVQKNRVAENELENELLEDKITRSEQLEELFGEESPSNQPKTKTEEKQQNNNPEQQPAENADTSITQVEPKSKSEEKTIAETKEYFDFSSRVNDRSRPDSYNATLKTSKFPMESLKESEQYSLSRIARNYGGYGLDAIYSFREEADRNSFIIDVAMKRILQDIIQGQQAIFEKHGKILEEAKAEAYKTLKADRYPEIKDFINRQVEEAIKNRYKKTGFESLADFKKLAADLAGAVKSYKEAGHLANVVLYEVLNQWHAEKLSRRTSTTARKKYDRAEEEFIEPAEKGELPLDTAYEGLKYFLRTGRIKKGDKKSITGADVDTRIINVVDSKDLNQQQKLLESFGKKLGVETVFFDNPDSKFNGAHAGNTSYINVNSKMPMAKVFWHEILHWLKANNPKLYQSLVNAAKITDKQREDYIRKTGRTDLDTDEGIDEEVIADQFEDMAKRTGLLQTIAGKNRGLIERVVQWLKDTMNKFVDYFRNPQGGLTTAQSQALASEFGEIAAQLKDSNGNKIFRYNNRTHDLEVIEGTKETVAPKSLPLELKYSISPNNNSSESLRQKIKNTMGTWFDENTPSERRDKRIKDTLSKITQHRLLFSHTKADQAIIDDFNKLIQAKHAYRWEELLPQIGGTIAKDLNLNPTQEMSNYIADWLLTGALNNTSAEKTAFQKAMRANPELAELMQIVRDTFQEISEMTPTEWYKSKIVHKEKEEVLPRLKNFIKSLWGERKNLVEQIFDDLHPVKRMIKQIKEKVSPQVAKMIDEMIDPYKMARLYRGKGAMADLMIDGTAEEISKIRKALQEQYPLMNFGKLKTLRMIIDEAGGKENLVEFEAFCIAKLDKEIYEKNRETNDDGTPKYEYVEPLGSEAYADDVIAKHEKQFGNAQRDLVTYSNILLTMQWNTGLLSDDLYSKILRGYKNYVPMARVFDENESYDFYDSFKRKTGGKRDTYSPIAKLLCNTQRFIAEAERNRIKLELAGIVHCGGLGEIIAPVEEPSPDVEDIIRYKENGKTKYLQVADITVKRAIDSMQSKSESNWLIKAVAGASKIMRGFLTFLNPDYAIGNIFRDTVDAFIHNKNLNANPFVAAMEVWRAGIKEVVGKNRSQDYIDWLANGGAQSGFVTEDMDTSGRLIRDLTKGTRWQRYTFRDGKNKLTRGFNFFSQILDDVNRLAEISEYATRLNTYKTAKTKLATKRANGEATVEDKRNAALMAREASIDFAKAGHSGRAINRFVLFSNAALQALALWGDTIKPANWKTKEGRKEIAGKIFRAISMGVFGSLIQGIFRYSDDDRKKEFDQALDWEKDTYWIFGDIKIPKGVDFGIRLLSALTDEVVDKMVSDDPIEFARVSKAFKDAAPSLTATIVTPILETMTNYSFFREAPIVPSREQHLPAHLQFSADTSWVAKQVGNIFGASPRNIDYLINGYLGSMGRFASRIPDTFTRGLTLDELPMVRRFVFTPYKNAKIVKDYYTAYNEQDTLYNGYLLDCRNEKNPELPKGYDRALHRRLKAAEEPMRNLSKREKKIMEDPQLTAKQRQSKLQELEKRRIAICEKVFNKAR